jgi:hypothetical protein
MCRPLDTTPRAAVDAVEIDGPRSAADTAAVPTAALILHRKFSRSG